MNRLIVLDSSIIVTLSGGQSSHRDGLARARSIIRLHGNQGDPVAIPTPAFAEVGHCDPQLFKDLRLLPLNAPAAVLANDLIPVVRREGSGSGCTRRALKVDALILAVAEERNASILYTEDPWFKSAATAQRLRVDVRDLPPPAPEQIDLPDAY